MIACMGGWCTRREKCPHYYAEGQGLPVERMCLPGRDGELLLGVPAMRFIPIRMSNETES